MKRTCFAHFLLWKGDDCKYKEEIIKGTNISIYFGEGTVGIYGDGIEKIYLREEIGMFEAGVLD